MTKGEAAKKLEALQDNGPTSSGFDFRTRFDFSGQITELVERQVPTG